MFWKKKKEPKQEYVVHITDDNFNEIIGETKKTILLDFWAPWCGPCKVIGPIIDELATEFKDKAIIAKVNIDQNPGLSAHFKVKSIPTLMFFSDGKYQERFNGLVPKPNLQEILNGYIEGNFKD